MSGKQKPPEKQGDSTVFQGVGSDKSKVEAAGIPASRRKCCYLMTYGNWSYSYWPPYRPLFRLSATLDTWITIQKQQAARQHPTLGLDQHRVALLELGAAGRLMMTGELEKVLPLEEAEKQAKPITPSGEVKLDPAKLKARNDAQVRMAFKHGPVAVVILGGAHYLKGSASRFTGGGCDYIRVTTRRFRDLSGR